MRIRAATTQDMQAVQSIYAHHVLHGLGTFETEPPDAAEMRARFDSITASGLPYLVADDAAGRVVGYAYANHFRTRAAYRYTVEDSIYLAPDTMRRGFGKLLLRQLIASCIGLGLREMLAIIGDSANAGSIGVHRACGFTHVGTMTGIGRKFDRWVDVVVMQRTLARDGSG